MNMILPHVTVTVNVVEGDRNWAHTIRYEFQEGERITEKAAATAAECAVHAASKRVYNR